MLEADGEVEDVLELDGVLDCAVELSVPVVLLPVPVRVLPCC